MSSRSRLHPEDVVGAFKDLNADVLVPVHWAVFQLSRHPWYEPVMRINDLAKTNGIDLFVPQPGALMTGRTDHGWTDGGRPSCNGNGPTVRRPSTGAMARKPVR